MACGEAFSGPRGLQVKAFSGPRGLQVKATEGARGLGLRRTPSVGSAAPHPLLLTALGSAFTAGLLGFRTAMAAEKKKGKDAKEAKGGSKKPAKAGDDDGEAGGEEEEFDAKKMIEEIDQGMEKTVDAVQKELLGIRAGRASPAMFDGLQVEVYGNKVSLKEVASVSAPDNSTLMVNCFDQGSVKVVEQAIKDTNMGFQTAVAGQNVKVSIPALTSDKRIQYVKLAKESGERGKTAIRNIRQNYQKKVKGLSKSESEDLVAKMVKQLDELTKKKCDAVDKKVKAKEDELSSV